MTRTVRKPFVHFAGDKGEKFYKRQRSSEERRRVRDAIALGNFDIGYQLVHWDEWNTNRDGGSYDNRLTIFTVFGVENYRAVMTWRQADLKARWLYTQFKTPIGVWREGWRKGCEYDGNLKFY